MNKEYILSDFVDKLYWHGNLLCGKRNRCLSAQNGNRVKLSKLFIDFQN